MTTTSTAEENKDLVRRSVDEGWNKGDMAVVDGCFAPSYVHHGSNLPDVRDLQSLKQALGTLAAGLPDMTTTLEYVIGEGDRVVKRWIVRGTHQGDLMGIPPTGKPVIYSGITIYRIEGGKIAEGWWSHDLLGLLRQLGAIPASSEPAPAAA